MTNNSIEPTEGQQLDAISGDEAKAILFQLRWFDPSTHFMSLHFNDEEFNQFQDCYTLYSPLSPEELISSLCEQGILDDKERKQSFERGNV